MRSMSAIAAQPPITSTSSFLFPPRACPQSRCQFEHPRRLIVIPIAFPLYPFPEVGRYRLSTHLDYARMKHLTRLYKASRLLF